MWRFRFLPGNDSQKIINLQAKGSGPFTPLQGVKRKDAICLSARCYINLQQCRKQNLFVKYAGTERTELIFLFPMTVYQLMGSCWVFHVAFTQAQYQKQGLSLHLKALGVTHCPRNAITAQKSHFQIVGWLWLNFLVINIRLAKHNLPLGNLNS